MGKIIAQKFFNRPTLNVAKELLGKFLVRRMGKRLISGMITGVEAYAGPNDKASHASRGRTKRTKVMFGKPGYWYVYLVYGMHHCLNIVTEGEGYPAAVLIRSVRTTRRVGATRRVDHAVNGPGRVCKFFKIDKSFNERQANKKIGLWIADCDMKVKPRMIKRGKRIGVDYAGKWKDKLWRFYI